MAGFPKNPLAGPDPFRDAAGQNLFRDPDGASEAELVEPSVVPTKPAAADEFGVTSNSSPLRGYERGDFEPLLVGRSGRIVIAARIALLVVAIAWLATVVVWLLVPSSKALQLSFLVWHLLVLILGGLAWLWGRDELEGIRIGAIDGRAKSSVTSARRVALTAMLLAIGGAVALVAWALADVE